MRFIKVDKNLCKGCEMCIVTCPKGILKMSEDINASGDNYCTQPDPSKCTACKFCAMICPEAAIEVYR